MIPHDVRRLIKEVEMWKINIKDFIVRLGWAFFIFAALAFGATVMVNASGKESINVGQGNSNLPSEKITNNEVAMFIQDAHQESEYFQVDVCYSLPDDRDWLLTSRPDDVLLKMDGQSYTLREEGVLDVKFTSSGKPTERCQYLLFPVTVKDGSTLSLSVKKIYVSEPDQVDCTILQKQLDDADSGIKVECPTELGLGGFTVVENPVAMTRESAQDEASNLLTDAHTGPWDFEFTFNAP
jgi:hypothetical protein